MDGHYNMRSPAVKRLMREAQELSDPTEQYFAQPLDDNLFEWHFTIRGPSDTEFNGGFYHGRIILPPEYPMKPPSIIFLTPNGRFDCFSKICLSISKHHPESWQPSWSIRTALLAIIGFMPTPGHGAIGSLDYTPEERKLLAKKSMAFKCERCGLIADKVLPLTSKSDETKKEIMDLAAQMSMTAEKSKGAENNQQAVAADTAPDVPHVADNVSPPISHVLQESTVTHRSTVPPSDAPRDPPASGATPTPSPAASSQSTTPLTPTNSQRPEQATRQLNRPRSTSCFDRTTFWALVVIGGFLAALILRRLAKFKYLLGEDDL